MFLLAVLILLFLFKLEQLTLPFFWDEAWVYSPALQNLAELGPSLIPGKLDNYLSRGHPLLFHFLGSSWIKMFGSSIFSIRLFAFCVSSFLLYATFMVGSKLFSKTIGLLAVILLVVNEMFIAQSSFIAPEILLATLGLLTVYFYINNNYRWYMLFGTLTLLTKESGIILIGVILLWELLKQLSEKKINLKPLFFAGVPVFVASLHFIYQKFIFGWFFFPEHIGLLETNPWYIVHKASISSHILFVEQGRWLLLLLPIIITVVSFLKLRFVTQALVLISSTLIILGWLDYKFFHKYFINDKYIAFLIVGTSIYFLSLLQRVTFKFFDQEKQLAFLKVVSIFIFLFLLFTWLNFYTNRYLLFILPFIGLFLGAIIDKLTRGAHRSIQISYLVIFCGTILLQANKNPTIGDCYINQSEAIQACQDMVTYLEKQKAFNTPIFTSFVLETSLKNKYAGYRELYRPRFRNIQDKPDSSTQYFVIPNFEPMVFPDSLRTKLTLVKEIRHNRAVIEIFRP